MNLILIGVDLVAIAIVVFALYVPRHRRGELIPALLGINVGVLGVTLVLATTDVSLGLGLGLFGVLSIIRLRSAELGQREVAYSFAALALGLVTGLATTAPLVQAAIAALIVVALWLGDHPRIARSSRRVVVTLDEIIADEGQLVARLERLLGGTVRRAEIEQIDAVRETMRVDVRVERAGARSRRADGPAGRAPVSCELLEAGCGADPARTPERERAAR